MGWCSSLSLAVFVFFFFVLFFNMFMPSHFLVETARDDDKICYSLDPNWKIASMVYAHVLRNGNDRLATLFLRRLSQ